MVMGDIVVTENEASAALDAALASGLEVTALHNHFFFDSPRVMFMHIGGSGTPERLAAAVARARRKGLQYSRSIGALARRAATACACCSPRGVRAAWVERANRALKSARLIRARRSSTFSSLWAWRTK
ncbi:MAG: DUF1259 domain-containing protein [Nitrospiraceae bacterium]|nr:DUF1259 domain-containing protein [Nitrospiraceae bacterium]